MDQQKIGAFLKTLRKEKGMTQEQLAEQFNVAGRTVSRWETGVNMPDLSLLVELAEFYHLDVTEIIDGERKGTKMDQEMKETLTKVAEYSDSEKKVLKKNYRKIIAWILSGFGVFIIITAMTIFPSESSWGAIYSTIGSIIITCGVFQLLKGYRYRFICAIASFIILLCGLITIDYIAVKVGGQVPRFAYMKSWTSIAPGDIVYKAPFYTVVRHNVDTENEYIEIK
ncbi:MAG TPA: helix-turn-helix domain-containing protein [Mogibacterium sp.]|nr:helix-turn-helix domain-containing protein [Mogibacterium sp.]